MKKKSKKNKYVRQHTKISMDKDLNVSNISISTNDKADYNKRMEKLNNSQADITVKKAVESGQMAGNIGTFLIIIFA